MGEGRGRGREESRKLSHFAVERISDRRLGRTEGMGTTLHFHRDNGGTLSFALAHCAHARSLGA